MLAVAAAHRSGVIRTARWPTVAAYLLAAGSDAKALAELAGLPPHASGWQVDALVSTALAEAAVPAVDEEEAADVLARLLSQTRRRFDHLIICSLASVAADRDYPGGRIGRAYYLEERLDCECHEGSRERQDTDRFENEVRARLVVEAFVGYFVGLATARVGAATGHLLSAA